MSYHIELTKDQSSLIEYINYFEETKELEVKVRWMDWPQTFIDVSLNVFLEFSETTSFGRFYNTILKPNFKLKQKQTHMADEKTLPKKINRAGSHTRKIEIDIDLSKVRKDWIFVTDKGVPRLKLRLVMKPDGEVSEYGQLGFITQPLPTELWKKAKKEGVDPEKDPILGNAEELEWPKAGAAEESYMPSEEEAEAMKDKLPF